MLIFAVAYKKSKDLFNPLSFFCFMVFLRYVPNMLIKDYEHFSYIDLNFKKSLILNLYQR